MSSASSLAYMSYLSSITNAIAFYSSAIINPIGILFSIIAAVIFFSSKSLNKTNMGYLYGLLSLSAAFSLSLDFLLSSFVNLLPYFGALTFLAGPLSFQNNTWCRLSYYLTRLSSQMFSWLHAYISFDRLIQLKFPARFNWWNSRLVINFILLVILLLIVFINWPNLNYYVADVALATLNQTISIRNGSQLLYNRTVPIVITTKYCLSDQSNSLASDLISASMRTWIPLALIVLFNALTTRSLAKSSVRVNSKSNQARQRRERKFTRTVMKMSFIFFGFNFPLSVSWIVLNAYRACCSSTAATVGIVEILLFNKLTIIIANLYQAKTALFSLIFNSLFRKEMKMRVKCQKQIANGSTSFVQSDHHHRSRRSQQTI